MTQAAQSARRSKLDYSHGKELAIQVFLGAMAAMDLRPAMLAKLKLEGELLKAGACLAFPQAASARRRLRKSRQSNGCRPG